MLFVQFAFAILSVATHSAHAESSFLSRSYENAIQNIIRVSDLLSKEVQKTEGYNVCNKNSYATQRMNDAWLINHYDELLKLQSDFDSTLNTINKKISTLTQQQAIVLPLRGQKTSEVKVSFQSLIEYFKIYNARIKSCNPSDLPALQKEMESPSSNILNLGHSQIVAATQTLTTTMNATLKDPIAEYNLSFTQKNLAYQLILKIKILEPDHQSTFELPIFSEASKNSSQNLKLSELEKWAILIKNNVKINSLPLDGAKRYLLFAKANNGFCKLLSSEEITEALPYTHSDIPFISHSTFKKNRSYFKALSFRTKSDQLCSKMKDYSFDSEGLAKKGFGTCSISEKQVPGPGSSTYIFTTFNNPGSEQEGDYRNTEAALHWFKSAVCNNQCNPYLHHSIWSDYKTEASEDPLKWVIPPQIVDFYREFTSED